MALKNCKEFLGSLFCHTIRFYSIKIALAGFEVTCDQLVLLSLQVSWKVGIFCKLVRWNYAHAILRTDKHFLALKLSQLNHLLSNWTFPLISSFIKNEILNEFPRAKLRTTKSQNIAAIYIFFVRHSIHKLNCNQFLNVQTLSSEHFSIFSTFGFYITKSKLLKEKLNWAFSVYCLFLCFSLCCDGSSWPNSI